MQNQTKSTNCYLPNFASGKHAHVLKVSKTSSLFIAIWSHVVLMNIASYVVTIVMYMITVLLGYV